MKLRTLRSFLILAGLAFIAATVALGGTGGYTYKTYCANCHGTGGRGDGTLASILTVKPADLTRIAARNGGKFDADEVRKRIDGRHYAAPNGPSDMPAWGDAFAQSEQAGGEAAVQARVDELVEYLRSIQVKRE